MTRLLTLMLALLAGCSSKPAIPAKDLLLTATDARAAGDWTAAEAAFEAAFASATAENDPASRQTARRGQLQAQSASDPTAALAAAEVWLHELGPAATVDLFGGLATDFKFTGATPEGVALCNLGLAAFPGDVGLLNAKARLEAALPTSPTAHP